MRTPMRHLIILLPGIIGSVLQKDGQDVWALSGQALGSYLLSLGRNLQSLQVKNEDWGRDDLGDGFTTPRVIEDLHSIPFLTEHAGYSVLRRRLKEYFDITEGSLSTPSDEANFFTFPYDWRRDNRVTARKLQCFIQNQLPRWRDWSGAKDAQVILIGHSLGGLISRHYAEKLGGWRDCRAVITVGSPHRGAIGALQALSGGFKGAFGDFSAVLRSFESAYQILPTYRVVEANGEYQRVAEMSTLPNIDPARAKAARDNFLDATRQAAIENRKEDNYRQRTIPWVGTRHDTLQSAQFKEGKLTVSYSVPAGLEASLADGDGTVPHISAIPSELDGEGLERFVVERHGWLTNNEMALEPLLDTIKQVVADGSQVLYGLPADREATRPSVNVRLEPLYLPPEPITVRVNLVNANEQPYNLSLQVNPVGQAGSTLTSTMQVDGTEAKIVELGNLATGLYQLTARAPTSAPNAPLAAHGVFEVADSAALG